jgi:hypothetical protein
LPYLLVNRLCAAYLAAHQPGKGLCVLKSCQGKDKARHNFKIYRIMKPKRYRTPHLHNSLVTPQIRLRSLLNWWFLFLKAQRVLRFTSIKQWNFHLHCKCGANQYYNVCFVFHCLDASFGAFLRLLDTKLF